MILPSGIEPASFRFLAQCIAVVCCPFEVQRGTACRCYRVCVLFYTENTWPNTLPRLVIKIHLWWGAFRKPHLSNAWVRTPFNFLSIPLQTRFEMSTFLLHFPLIITAFMCAHVLIESTNNYEYSFVIGRVKYHRRNRYKSLRIYYEEYFILWTKPIKNVVIYRIGHRN
jgi:hypothetical protein